MARPSKMTGWWKLLLEHNGGHVDELAKACGVSVRNLLRWSKGEIKVPDLEKRKRLQVLAGPELLKHPQCPKYLRFRIVVRELRPGERPAGWVNKPSPMKRAEIYSKQPSSDRVTTLFTKPKEKEPLEAGSLAYLLSLQ